jgi:hypothetical protein
MGERMRIFVAHDFTHPPIRNYREPFRRIGDKYTVQFVFADQVHAADHLLEQIEDMIVQADACLFDLSTANRNVFLELGFARGRDKPHYLLFRPMPAALLKLGFVDGLPDVPTDIRGQRVLRYFTSRSLRLQLDDLVVELLSRSDLSGHQDMLEARVEDLLTRNPAGLVIGQIASELKLNQTLAFAVVKILIEQHRVEATGYGSGMRYLKASGPAAAAE